MAALGITYTAFLALLKNALWDKPVPEGILPLSGLQWERLYRMAWTQAVTGVLYDAVSRLPNGSGLTLSHIGSWMTSVNFIEENNARMNATIARMESEWKSFGVTAIVQKGKNIARMYPVPTHRISGDIDWYFPTKADWNKGLALAKPYGPETDSDGDIHYKRDGIVMEHHRHGSDPDDPISVLIMVNEHILHHAMVMGIGFRHLCDMAMAYRYYKGRYDPARLKRRLKRMGLWRWTRLMDAFLVEVLEMPEDYLAFPYRKNIDVSVLEYLIISDGNLGLSKENRMSGFRQRAPLFLKYAPARFLGRYASLTIGRLRRGIRSQD